MWDTLEMAYGVYPNINKEEMNSQGEKDECLFHNKIQNVEILEALLEPLSLTSI